MSLSRKKATERAISIREPFNTGGNIPIETKFIPIETKVVRTKKKFSEKSLLSRLLDKPTDKRTFEQNHLRLI